MSHVFVTRSIVPPLRWRQAYPEAGIVHDLPRHWPPEALLWLHNQPPDAFAGRIPAGIKVIVMDDEPTDAKGLAALSGGASGYVNAHATPEVLHMVETVVRNHGLWVGESLLTRVMRNLHTVTAARESVEHPELDKLSERERDVALRVARGDSNKEIARSLDLAERTVKAHLSSAFHKLGVRDRLQLALLLRREA